MLQESRVFPGQSWPYCFAFGSQQGCPRSFFAKKKVPALSVRPVYQFWGQGHVAVFPACFGVLWATGTLETRVDTGSPDSRPAFWVNIDNIEKALLLGQVCSILLVKVRVNCYQLLNRLTSEHAEICLDLTYCIAAAGAEASPRFKAVNAKDRNIFNCFHSNTQMQPNLHLTTAWFVSFA